MARPKPLAEFVDVCLGRALAAQGFAASDVILAWADIVGERLAAFSQPLRIDWPRRGAGRSHEDRPDPATLVVRVEGAFALEMQHLAPVVIERVNAYYGWRCVGRLVLKQGPVRRPRPAATTGRTLTAEEQSVIGGAVAPIAEEGLRQALDRLGSAVLSQADPGTARDRPAWIGDSCHIASEVLPQAPMQADRMAAIGGIET